MTPATKQAIIKALKAEAGHAYDNLYHATIAFTGLSAEDMKADWGGSGKTRQEILDSLTIRHAEAKATLAEAEREL